MSKRVAVRRASAFAPTEIPNMVLHLDATSGVYVDAGTTEAADGERVQQWSDGSGQGNHVTQATANNRPTFRTTGFAGAAGVDFTPPSFYGIWAATPEFLDTSFNTAATLFYIGAATAGTVNRMALCNTCGVGELGEWNRFDVNGLGVPVSERHGAQTLTGNVRCVGVSYDGTTLRTIINGHLIKIARTGDLGMSGALTVGDFATRAGIGQFRGCIGEAFMWRYGATDTQMRRMCAHLLDRWGYSAPSPARSVCCVGDSLTAYTGTRMWPSLVADALGTTGQSHTTVAQPGVSLAFINEIAAGWVDPVLDASQALQVNVVWAGTNDIAGGADGATVYSRLADYCAARRAAGWDTLIVLTMLPRSAAGDDANTETARQAYNTLIRANYAEIADALADVAADGRIGDAGDELDTTYYQEDRVHLNSAGQAVVAGIVQPVLEALL